MVKVKFKTRSSGPNGQILPGQIVEVPEGEAALLVVGGYAERVDPVVTETIEFYGGNGEVIETFTREVLTKEAEAGKSEIQGDKPADSGARKPGGRKAAPSGAARRK